jgi:hypothetical protein
MRTHICCLKFESKLLQVIARSEAWLAMAIYATHAITVWNDGSVGGHDADFTQNAGDAAERGQDLAHSSLAMSVEKAASTPGLPAGDEEALATRARTTSASPKMMRAS